jgi:DNA-binding response OmpR family regulator
MSHLLLVKDDDTVRGTLALNLRAEGTEVDTAADGEEGLRLARQASPDLIILDVMLPKLDGLTVSRLVRRESQVSILLLTARHRDREDHRPGDRRRRLHRQALLAR